MREGWKHRGEEKQVNREESWNEAEKMVRDIRDQKTEWRLNWILSPSLFVLSVAQSSSISGLSQAYPVFLLNLIPDPDSRRCFGFVGGGRLVDLLGLQACLR